MYWVTFRAALGHTHPMSPGLDTLTAEHPDWTVLTTEHPDWTVLTAEHPDWTALTAEHLAVAQVSSRCCSPQGSYGLCLSHLWALFGFFSESFRDPVAMLAAADSRISAVNGYCDHVFSHFPFCIASVFLSALVLFFPLSFLEHTVLRMTHCPNAFSFPAHSLLITPPEKCHFGNKDDKEILASWQYQKEDSSIKNNSWKLPKKIFFMCFFSPKIKNRWISQWQCLEDGITYNECVASIKMMLPKVLAHFSNLVVNF